MYSICTWFYYRRLDPDFHFFGGKGDVNSVGQGCYCDVSRISIRCSDWVTAMPYLVPESQPVLNGWKWFSNQKSCWVLPSLASVPVVFFFFCVWNVQISLIFFWVRRWFIHMRFAFRLRLACLLSAGTILYVNIRSILWTPFHSWKNEGF